MIGNAKVSRKNCGWLINGNPPGDLTKAPRCGAKTRRGSVCRAPRMQNGRCRLHGGKSTGPRTAEGLARAQRGNWKHGKYSKIERARREADEASHFRAEMEAYVYLASVGLMTKLK